MKTEIKHNINYNNLSFNWKQIKQQNTHTWKSSPIKSSSSKLDIFICSVIILLFKICLKTWLLKHCKVKKCKLYCNNRRTV